MNKNTHSSKKDSAVIEIEMKKRLESLLDILHF
jgi:hypothetical protein